MGLLLLAIAVFVVFCYLIVAVLVPSSIIEACDGVAGGDGVN